MREDEIEAELRAMFARQSATLAENQAATERSRCPSPPRVRAGMLSAAESAHVAACPYCRELRGPGASPTARVVSITSARKTRRR